jgi:hypothetical protein
MIWESYVMRGVARCGLAVIPVLVGACTARDPLVSSSAATPSGAWRIERQIDRVTGAPLASAFVTSAGASNSAVDFPKPATMQISCFKDQPLIRFAFEFKVGSNKNSELGYRFDDKPGHEPTARFLQNDMIVVIEDKSAVAEFLKDLASSNSLYIRIRSLNAGRSSAEFRLDGAPAAIEQALGACYSPTGQPRKPGA